eukprot:c12741_g1_i1.p1 GENE.c12741_g1_i1~~c12741_g1_i1.p1  ORF type:complete len:613 (-),score=210.18 c12741_g1_i1:12-1850(-)
MKTPPLRRRGQPGKSNDESGDTETKVVENQQNDDFRFGSQKQWNKNDWVIVTILFFCNLYLKLWRIEVPQSVVWDESHFTKFLTWYVTGHYFVDIHPPLAKLAHALVLYLSPYEGPNEYNVRWWTDKGFVGTSDWKLIYENDYGAPYVYIRTTNAFMGSFLVAITYATARAMGCRKYSAVFCAWLILCENLITLQSRVILTDVFLYFFNMATYGASFMSIRKNQTLNEEIFWSILTGILLGCSLSVKFTALGTFGMVGFSQIMALVSLCFVKTKRYANSTPTWSQLLKKAIVKGGTIVGLTILVCCIFWTIHINLLPYSGQGTGFMEQDYQLTLVPKLSPEQLNVPEDACPNHLNALSDCGYGGITQAQCEAKGCCYDPTSPRNWCYHRGKIEFPKMSLPRKIKSVIKSSHKNNQGESMLVHPDMSQWWEWPTMNMRFVNFGSYSGNCRIVAAGNPFVWWSVFGTLITSFTLCSFFFIKKRMNSSQRNKPTNETEDVKEIKNDWYWITRYMSLWFGYSINLFPYILIPRSKFGYHYIPALEVGCLLIALCVEKIFSIVKSYNSTTLMRVFQICLLMFAILIGVSHWYWSVWTYGFPITTAEHESRKWVKKWQ